MIHFFAVLTIVLAAAASSSAAASPRIEIVGGESVDLGRGRPGKYIHQLAITNTGSDTLQLLSLSSGCGCLTGDPDRTVLAPGDTAHVQITIETSGQIVEKWSRVLGIASTDPSRRVVEVVFRLSFQHDIRLSTLVNTIHRERCDSLCVWRIDIENISDSILTIRPPFIEEMRGVHVAFDMTEARQIAPGEKIVISGRVTMLGGEDIPSARAMLYTSGQFDPETSLGWFYLPDER